MAAGQGEVEAPLLNLEGRPTVPSYSSQPGQVTEAGKPEGLPGSQIEQTGNEKIIITPEEENNPAFNVSPRAQWNR